MKKGIVILGGIFLVLSLIVMTTGNQQEVVVTDRDYTHIQEQGATGDFQSPVIHDTAKKVSSALIGQ